MMNFYPVIPTKFKKEANYCIRLGHSLRSAKWLISCAWMTRHARREFFFPPNRNIFPVLSITETKQIINLLLLNHFCPTTSHTDEFERKRKRRIIVYCSVTRYGQILPINFCNSRRRCLSVRKRCKKFILLADTLRNNVFEKCTKRWQ